jgi:hypothetical protein
MTRASNVKPPQNSNISALVRSLDIALASLGLCLLSYLLIVIAIVVRASSPGSVLVRQNRTGLYMFRTTSSPDGRATWLGRLLQQSGLHELPQLLSVIKGDASLVKRLSTQVSAQKVASDASSARIVVVEWRIKKGSEKEFLEYWSERSTIPDRSGLIGEFLSRVENRNEYPWMIWDLDERWTTFINVGFWRDGADFQEQVGRFIDNTRPSLAFEADRRRRLLVAPQRWRVGKARLLATDHQRVR